ncbi:hypothetical protein KQ306_08545 [Synechococcus sp. CS-1324]|uniref:hypothetical protein n=1 Tax=Synechococcus sp. CS-1324 TaxID=2847980 RepID=UPI00223AABDE|nr:hypothetical protein [Synechococcus sp. CS-1324]MCT0230897.1 hypothetical protein [Synechococcus sp. CS-1324]
MADPVLNRMYFSFFLIAQDQQWAKVQMQNWLCCSRLLNPGCQALQISKAGTAGTPLSIAFEGLNASDFILSKGVD